MEELQDGEVSLPAVMEKAQKVLGRLRRKHRRDSRLLGLPGQHPGPDPRRTVRHPDHQPRVGGQVRAQVLEQGSSSRR
ncbi:hypothetical protein LV779_24975 [Streptomyces thinghirensis]|nr:hypothetical protein [Streptomyces thinghirensis]